MLGYNFHLTVDKLMLSPRISEDGYSKMVNRTCFFSHKCLHNTTNFNRLVCSVTEMSPAFCTARLLYHKTMLQYIGVQAFFARFLCCYRHHCYLTGTFQYDRLNSLVPAYIQLTVPVMTVPVRNSWSANVRIE